jgi:hypothetical protein
MATTAICISFKQEILQAIHNFNATQSAVSCAGTSGAFALTGLASTNGLSVGMAVTGTNIGAGAVVAGITSATAVLLSAANTGTVTAATFTGDVFKIALVKASPSLTYSGTQTNIGTPGSGTPTLANLGTDETSGTGYTSGGAALTNITPSVPATPGTVGTTQFGNPSWTSASFSATAGIIYNTSTRGGGAAAPLNNRTVGVFDFGGTQTVSAGTLTLLMPTNDGNNALIRIA